jgi:uncharacterized glyoxalase superfamily protein PhnB
VIDKLHERINVGNAARRILEDEIINAVFSALGQEWMQHAVITAGDANKDIPVSFLRRVSVLEEIKGRLKTLVANGGEAARELEKMQPAK